jgi:hypothetical protein
MERPLGRRHALSTRALGPRRRQRALLERGLALSLEFGLELGSPTSSCPLEALQGQIAQRTHLDEPLTPVQPRPTELVTQRRKPLALGARTVGFDLARNRSPLLTWGLGHAATIAGVCFT